MTEEPILPLHDFGTHLQDRLRPLLQRFHQPVGRGQLLAQKSAILAAGLLADARVKLFVHQHARQRFGVQFQYPVAARRRAHEHVRDHWRQHGNIPPGARLGVQGTDFGDHIGQILPVHTAHRHQLAMIAPRQQFQIGHQRRHCRIQPVLVAQLGRQAFGQATRETADGIEPHHVRAHRFHGRQLRT